MTGSRVIAILAAGFLVSCSDPEDGSRSSLSAIRGLDFPALNQSDYNPESGALIFPDSLASLDGEEIWIAGFMAPYDELDDMTRFMLMPSYVGCHFCKPPALNQVLYVEQEAEPGRRRPPGFVHDPIRVTGTLRLFSLESEHPAHLAEFVYALDNARIEVLEGMDALERAQAVHTRTGKENPAHDGFKPPAAPAEENQARPSP
jgi:hypothetical protein